MTNSWCGVQGIEAPRLEAVVTHPAANNFGMLVVALLERGAPMTLREVAARFEEAGIAELPRALLSLQRCKPARAPVFRDGELYHLDQRDEELARWVFRLGLRPPRHAPIGPSRPEPPPPPGPEVPLSHGELDEAWTDAHLFSWSAPRLVLAVLDASGGPRPADEVVAEVARRTRWHGLRSESSKFARRGSAVEVLPDGRWAITAYAAAALDATRSAVRVRVALARRQAAQRPDPATVEARVREVEQRRAAHSLEFARLSRAILAGFPANRPQAVALLDVGAHEIRSFVGEELEGLPRELAVYDVLGAVEVRKLLQTLGFDPGPRRLAELGPPQKTRKLNQAGRKLQITTALLVQGSCGISRPFGGEESLSDYLATGDLSKLRRRLEADVKSLHALYEYGRLHGVVRLRWGFLDEQLSAPWAYSDEARLYDLKKAALAANAALEVVAGNAPGWADPWSRRRLARVVPDGSGWGTRLVDEEGLPIFDLEVQRARLADRGGG